MKISLHRKIAASLMLAGMVQGAVAETLTHKLGDYHAAGDFVINEQGAHDSYEGLKADEFGYFFLNDIMDFSTMQPFSIKGREYHYYIPSDMDITKKSKSLGIGMRVIPVVDGKYEKIEDAPIARTAENALGQSIEVRGSELMDKALRQSYGYQGQDLIDGPIFAYMAYFHPEKSKSQVSFPKLGDASNLKTENGITHMGAYIGNGNTRNSPYTYHQMTWGHKSGKLTYPVNMYVMTYKGAKTQKVFNTNGVIALRTLNELNGGPKFPPDYKFDKFKTISLEKNLEFYRAWIDPTWKKDPSDTQSVYKMMTSTKAQWDTYCAEHLTIALNIALNVEHNEEGFKKIWGDIEGADLWKKLQDRWATDLKSSFSPIVDADFEALWEIDKVKNPTKKAGVGAAMAWAPETTAELVRDFVQQYVPFNRVGANNTALTIFGFAKEFQKRMGMAPQQFAGLTIPVLSKMYKHEISTKVADAIEAQLATQGFNQSIHYNKNPMIQQFVGALIAHMQPQLEQQSEGAVQKYIAGMDQLAAMKPEVAPAAQGIKLALGSLLTPDAEGEKAEIKDIVKLALELIKLPKDRRGVKANDSFLAEVKPAFKRAIDAKLSADEAKYQVKYYSPPAILRRIYLGLHKSHDTLKVIPVATAVRVQDVEPKEIQPAD